MIEDSVHEWFRNNLILSSNHWYIFWTVLISSSRDVSSKSTLIHSLKGLFTMLNLLSPSSTLIFQQFLSPPLKRWQIQLFQWAKSERACCFSISFSTRFSVSSCHFQRWAMRGMKSKFKMLYQSYLNYPQSLLPSGWSSPWALLPPSFPHHDGHQVRPCPSPPASW